MSNQVKSGFSISVVMPCFNAAKYIRQTLDSYLAQDYPDFELIVVDDGSTDDTPQIVSSYLPNEKLRFIQLPRPASGGPARPRNVGVAYSTGRLLVFNDDDDPALPGKLSALVAALKLSNNSAVWLCNDFSNIDIEGAFLKNAALRSYSRLQATLAKSSKIGEDVYRVDHNDILEVLLATSIVRGCNIAVLRDNLYSTAPFDETLRNGEDLDFVMRLSRRLDCLFIDRELGAYRIRNNSMSTFSNERMVPSRLKVLHRQQQAGLNAAQTRAMNYAIAENAFALGYEYRINRKFRMAFVNYAKACWYRCDVAAVRGLIATLLRVGGKKKGP